MPRLNRGGAGAKLVFCVPCRNEAHNLPECLAHLGPHVLVFDDESTDGTADVARALGVQVISPHEALPQGWTGKNRACHELALAALETDAEWVVFLDADTVAGPDFAERLSATLGAAKETVATGFLRMRPGAGWEPVYLAWVFWIVLASNPFFLVHLTRRGHNGFLNGQFVAWRREMLTEHRPYEQVRGEILEDVILGRWLARQRIPVLCLNVASSLSVQMYTNLSDAVPGMLKNSHAIAGRGSLLLALFMLFVAWAWVVDWRVALVAFAALIGWPSRDQGPVAARLLMPLSLTAGAITILLSRRLKRQGRLTWKGRTYS